MYLTGVLQAFGLVLLGVAFNIYIRMLSLFIDTDPIIFTLFSLLSGACIMTLIAGPGRFAKDTIFHLTTWVYGISSIIALAIDLYVVSYATGTEAGLFSRWAVPACFLGAMIFLKRKPTKTDFFANILILIGAITLIYIQSPENKLPLLILGLGDAIFLSIMYLISETHKVGGQAQQSGDLRDKMRVMSFATFVTSTMCLLLVIAIALLKHNNLFPTSLDNSFLPTMDSLKDFDSMLAGFVWGCIFAPIVIYFRWSASYKITAESVLAIYALTPIFTLIFEYSISNIPAFNVNMSAFEGTKGTGLLFVVFIMTLGAGMSAYMKSFNKIKESEGDTWWEKFKNSSKLESENLAIGVSQNNMADYEVIKNTIDFYEGDEVKAAEMLELPLDTVKTLSLTKNAYALRDDVSKKVHDIFRNKIFYLDQLTGVENRKGLIRQFATYQDEDVKFKLFYMDINKFKQINDTLGHDIGDIAIITTVHRIRNYAEKNKGFTYRLGGDEFAMMTTSNKSEEQVIEEIKAIVNQPIDYDESGNKGTLNPSISIGKANVIKDAEVKIKDLIKSADENMYKDKQESKDNEVLA